MFFPTQGPAEPVLGALQALKLSLNTPVVAIDCLPVGPARAAIALHVGSPERIRVSVAVRSLRTGEVAYFSSGDEIQGLGSGGVALDAALSFAEGMGFLFDDDEVEARGEKGPQEAAGLWRELAGSGPEPPERSAPQPPRVQQLGRLALSPRQRASEETPAAVSRPFWLDAVPKPALAESRSSEVFSPHSELPKAADPAREAAPVAQEPAPPAAAEEPVRPRAGALFQLIAQTAIDRICADPPSPEAGEELPLSKFRFLQPQAGEPEALLGAAGDAPDRGPATEPPPAPPRRSALRALQLRLLSRF